MTTMYTVFGCLNTDDQPQVRVDDDVDIPDAELTDGVQHVHVEFTTHGDDTQDAFLRVAAVDLQAAQDVYDRLFHAVKLVLPWLWGGDVPTVRVEVTDGGSSAFAQVPFDLVGWTKHVSLHGRVQVRGMVIR